jgi:hypothetical protein
MYPQVAFMILSKICSVWVRKFGAEQEFQGSCLFKILHRGNSHVRLFS